MPRYYAVIDFECTCWENYKPDDDWGLQHEIIEFPVVFVNSQTLEIDFEFHAYVRPIENPVLSPFCYSLTGIEQAWVDEAEELETVLAKFERFLQEHAITDFTPCTDGPWDFQKFLYSETKRKGLAYPPWALKWIDIRRRFEVTFKLDKWVGVNGMLEILGLEFEGRPHSGIDDARNIARIVIGVHKKLEKPGFIRPNRNLRTEKNTKKSYLHSLSSIQSHFSSCPNSLLNSRPFRKTSDRPTYPLWERRCLSFILRLYRLRLIAEPIRNSPF